MRIIEDMRWIGLFALAALYLSCSRGADAGILADDMRIWPQREPFLGITGSLDDREKPENIQCKSLAEQQECKEVMDGYAEGVEKIAAQNNGCDQSSDCRFATTTLNCGARKGVYLEPCSAAINGEKYKVFQEQVEALGGAYCSCLSIECSFNHDCLGRPLVCENGRCKKLSWEEATTESRKMSPK